MAGFNFGTPTSAAAPSFSLGNNPTAAGTSGFNFVAPATNSTASALQFNVPTSTAGTNTFGTGTSGFSFGATGGGLSMGTPATNQAKPVGLTFGSPATSTGLSFGSTPNQPTLGFGSTTATSTPGLTFGSTPATTQQGLSFGSTPATTQQGLSFGSTPATTQQGLSFGSTPAQPSLTFGSTPATTQQTLTFGSTPATSQPLSFGSTAGATTQPGLNFGLSTPAATTASTGFSLGTPATSGALSFGLGGQSTAPKPTLSFGATTTASTTTPLLNFSTPKPPASTGFSLAVSGAGTGTGSLFSLPTTSAAPTSSAPAIFKGLGGVDSSSTQGTGQKDVKSVKENIVNPEIMQSLDVFKNFVKQQKNLSCEVSRAPVKPMHKVTEDTDALNKLLTSVSSALQKNRVIANKLKADTTKCLSLCEMAQRTHDTPPGLQNDNVAPLEFFIQLVSKFERDIQILRQEIDNTEKHVNSLSFPAILTPQELSIALRRLHDSFVALAGRLQTAHAGVIAQRQRHLSLRRHFLKDTTNVFETPTTATKKPFCRNVLPMPGPTPFSSMGDMTSLMAGPDKHVTFSTGTPALTGWGSSLTSANATTSTFLQSPGTNILGTSQTSDAQSFQLGKPPPGNKRGKR